MTRQQAIEIARQCAKAKPQSYYAEPFQPHEWVIDAIMRATVEPPAAPPLWAAVDAQSLRAIAVYQDADDTEILSQIANRLETIGASEPPSELPAEFTQDVLLSTIRSAERYISKHQYGNAQVELQSVLRAVLTKEGAPCTCGVGYPDRMPHDATCPQREPSDETSGDQP